MATGIPLCDVGRIASRHFLGLGSFRKLLVASASPEPLDGCPDHLGANMRFTVFFLCTLPLLAGTRIVDRLQTADGKPAEGALTISWPPFMSNGKTIQKDTLRLQVVSGAVNVTLEPNDTAFPPGTSYTVEFQSKAGVKSLEYWIVPTSASPVTIGAIRTNTIPTPNLIVAPGQTSSGAHRRASASRGAVRSGSRSPARLGAW
jgi:hypothetical protein